MSEDALAPTVVTPAPTESAAIPVSSSEQQPLSKKAQKKLAKAAYIAEKKLERRAAEKERKKEKKRALAEKRAAGELEGEEAGRDRKRQKIEQGPRTPFGARIVIDLGFDDKMTENVSLATPTGPWLACPECMGCRRRSSRSRPSWRTHIVRTGRRHILSRRSCSLL